MPLIFCLKSNETFSISGLRFALDHGKLDFVAGGNVGSILQLWNSGSAGIGLRAMKVGINTNGSLRNPDFYKRIAEKHGPNCNIIFQ